jgi:hypothetical protein
VLSSAPGGKGGFHHSSDAVPSNLGTVSSSSEAQVRHCHNDTCPMLIRDRSVHDDLPGNYLCSLIIHNHHCSNQHRNRYREHHHDPNDVSSFKFVSLPHANMSNSTPTPVTAYSGKAKTTTTVTAPTPTRTRTSRTYETVWTTKTIWATYVDFLSCSCGVSS